MKIFIRKFANFIYVFRYSYLYFFLYRYFIYSHIPQPLNLIRLSDKSKIKSKYILINRTFSISSVSPDGHDDGGGVGSSSSSMTSCWCHVAYWELRERVGPLFSVHDSCVRVFQHLPQAAGMCLAQMQPDTTSSRTTSGSGDDVTRNNDVIMRVRDKIGAGVTLSLEEDGTHVWLYNRCDYPVFVNSPTLELPNSRTTVVKKVPPGYSLQIFDFERSEMLECVRDPQLYQDGPYDPHSIRISFAKGWGPHYSRQFITSCPCWIEVLLRINR